MIKEITSSRDVWLAFAKFCEDVMHSKEETERVREALNFSPPGSFDPN